MYKNNTNKVSKIGIFIFTGHCVELASSGILNGVSCKTFSSGCPDAIVFSPELFKCRFIWSIYSRHNTDKNHSINRKNDYFIGLKYIIKIFVFPLYGCSENSSSKFVFFSNKTDPKCLAINTELGCFDADVECIVSRYINASYIELVNNKKEVFISSSISLLILIV